MFINKFMPVLLLGISFHAVLSQLPTQEVLEPISNTAVDGPVVQIQEEQNTVDVDTEEDDDDQDVRNQIRNVETIEEFMNLLQIQGRQLTPNDIYDDLTDENGKEVISGGGRLAVPDNCAPRNTTIRITMEGTDPDVAFFPRCTKIERCGGCCSSPNLECRPLYTERVSLKVLKGRIPYPGASHLEYSGFAPVIVDRHVTCRVACILTRERCGPKKRFLRQQCTCKCKRFAACRPPTIWDGDQCACRCPEVINCCIAGGNCGMRFNNRTCECEISYDGRRFIAAESSNTATSTTTTETTTTNDTESQANTTISAAPATTTTGAPTTPLVVDPCETRVCLPTHIKVRRGSMCFCRPNRRTPPTTVATGTTTTGSAASSDPCATRVCLPNFDKVRRGSQCFCRYPMRNRGLMRTRNHNRRIRPVRG